MSNAADSGISPPLNPLDPVSLEFCIVAFRSENVIAHAIASVSGVPNSSIAVCDNSPDGSSLTVAAQSAATSGIAIRSIVATENPGFAAACNMLARSSDADWLVFLNPDATVIAWPWGLGGPAGGRIVGAEQVDSSGRLVGAYGTKYDVAEEIRRSWLRRPSPKPNSRGFVGGGAMAIERSRFLELGGFDSAFFLFYEDIDLCMRAAEIGLPVFVDTAWKVQHDHGHSARRNLRHALLTSYNSGRLFHRRYGHGVVRYDVYIAVDALLRWSRSVLLRNSDGRRAYAAVARASIGNLSRRQMGP